VRKPVRGCRGPRAAGCRFPIFEPSLLKPANLLLAFALLVSSGCIARYIRMEEKGMTCVEAQRVAVDTVRRMNYEVNDYLKAAPGSPGMIVALRQEGTKKEELVVRVYCTTQGSEVEAQTDQSGLGQLGFTNEFRRSFEAVAANRAPPRPAAEQGVDVLMTPERSGGDLGVDLSSVGVLPVSVRITNHTARTYRFRVAGVVLQTDDGARVRPLATQDVIAKLAGDDAQTVRQKVLTDHKIEAGAELTGFLFFPFQSYARARVELIDLASDESEGFSIEF
jgi:hypothetical protein